MNKFVHRTLCRNYESAARAVIAELRRLKRDMMGVNVDIIQDYQESLKLLRQFLDHEVGVMPKPKWHYDDKDESTWLFTHRKGINKTFLLLQDRRR